MWKLCFLTITVYFMTLFGSSLYGADHNMDMQFAHTSEHYALRMNEQIQKFGPRVAQVYYAFENTNGAVWFSLEENEELMSKLLNIFERYPNLPRLLHNDSSFSRNVALYLQEGDRAMVMLDDLDKLDYKQMQILSRQDSDPLKASICMLMPGAPLHPLKTMSQKKLMALYLLARQIAPLFLEDSDFKSLPKSAFDIQMRVINAWGADHLLEVLSESPSLAQAIVPPIDFREMEALQLQPSLYPGSAKLRNMQDDYIHFMRELYLEARLVRSPAWAAELCLAFADNIALSLLKNDDDYSRHIRSFLIAFIQNGEIFTNLIRPTSCNENGSNLTEVANALLLMENFSLPKDLLTSLALWYTEGRLANILEGWSKNVTAMGFSAELDNFNSMNLESHETEFSNMRFLVSIATLAQLRSTLGPEQAKLLDQLLMVLHIDGDPLYMTPYFLAEYGDEFFKFMASRNFSRPVEVSRKILHFGYPDSKSRSLYECFRREQKREKCSSLKEITDKRGRLPESDLLQDGLLFGDKYGVEPDTLYDVGDIGLGVILSVATGGVGSARLVYTAARIALKTAARQGIKQGIKKTVRLIASPPKSGRKLAKRMARLSGNLKNLPKNTSSPKQSTKVQEILAKLDRVHTAGGYLKTVMDWYFAYMADQDAIPAEPVEVSGICPQEHPAQ